jgi:hypothetical protein
VRQRILVLIAVLSLMSLYLAPLPAGAASGGNKNGPIPVSISDKLKHRDAPRQPSVAQAAAAVSQGATSASQCGGDSATLPI